MAFLLSIHLAFTQNLIPNSGFEEVEECPTGLRQFNKVSYWNAATAGTPEFFHTCGYTGPISAYAGDGMAGVIFHAAYARISAEYIQVALKDSLEKGKSYCLSYYIRLDELSPIAINKIGAYFSREALHSSRWQKFFKPAQAVHEEVIDNKNEWKKVESSFIAKGGEKYITLGSFFEKHYLKEKVVGENMQDWMSYYYLDNVELYPSEEACNKIQREALTSSEENTKWKHTVYFDKDKAEPNEGEMERLIDFLSQLPSPFFYPIRVEGHTDIDASFEYNLQLSKRRAERVKETILERSPMNVYTSWSGEEKTVNDNLNQEEKAKNRRVEIEIIRE